MSKKQISYALATIHRSIFHTSHSPHHRNTNKQARIFFSFMESVILPGPAPLRRHMAYGARTYSRYAAAQRPTALDQGPGRRMLSTTSSRKSLATPVVLAGLGISFVGGLVAATVAPRPKIIDLVFPRATPAPVIAASAEGEAHTQQIEEGIQSLPIVKQLREETVERDGQVVKRWKETRPYHNTVLPHSLTSYSLKGPGRFAVAPLAFVDDVAHECVFVTHVGASMCGHEGVVHGGLLAVILDECLGRTAFITLPNHIGVTATLTVNYRSPTFADQYLITKTKVDSFEGRKTWASGKITDKDGKILVEATGLFVEPKFAAFLKNSTIAKHIK